jgi:hypothetical protein
MLGSGSDIYLVCEKLNSRSLAPHFGNVPHPWALPIVEHQAKFIMNQTYVDHEVYK